MGDFAMPSLGADMEAATLVEWLVKPGQRLAKGDLVAVVETSKGAVEVETFSPGTVAELLVNVGAKVPVGTAMARLVDDGAAAPPPPAAVAVAPSPAAPPPTGGPPLVSPAARRRAAELGVDLRTLSGSGPGGAIVLADVERKEAAPPAPPPPAQVDRSAAMRQAIAQSMARSKRDIPHYYLSLDVDLFAATAWLEKTNASLPPAQRILPAALFLKAVAAAATKYPDLNGFHEGGEFRPSKEVHVGVAISLRGGGLVAPAILDVASKPLVQVMQELSDLVVRVREGRVRGSELTSPTITVTNLGAMGVGAAFPIIHPPQVAIVAFGRVEERPWVVDHQVVARPVLTMSLGADHRVSDGHGGGLFLRTAERLLQHPEDL